MNQTRQSLLHEIGSGDATAWAEADAIYRPLIRCWLTKYHLQHCDVEDLTQEVLSVLIREAKNFQHNGRVGAFRNWLRTTTANLAGNSLRRRNVPIATGNSDFNQMLAALHDPTSHVSRLFDQEHDRWVIRRLLERVENDFEPITMQIFRTHVIKQTGVKETASQLCVSEASVLTAKSRVLRKLRMYASDLLEDSQDL